VGDRKRPDTGEDVKEAQVFDRAPGRHGGGGGGVERKGPDGSFLRLVLSR
jgi:hypothetical protein